MVKNNTEEIEFLAETHGVVFPIKVSDFSSIELLSDEEIEKRYLEYMGTECNTLFVDKTKLPKKMRVCFNEFGFDRVIVFSDFVNADDGQKVAEIWELIFRMMTDFCVSFIAIEFADGMAYSETIEFQNDSEKVKVNHPETGWFVIKEGGCTKARLLEYCCLEHD